MKNLILISLMFVLPDWINGQPAECEDCRRTAKFDDCTRNDPMGIVSSDAYYPSIFVHVAELAITPCFHMTGRYVAEHTESIKNNGIDTNYGTKGRIPEYSFESDLVSGLWMYDDEGDPVRSKLTVKLYFEGEQRELVDQWQALGTQAKGMKSIDEPNQGTSWSGLCNKIEHEFKNGSGTDEIIRRFEKRPADCTIEPEKDEVDLGESIEIKITGIVDASGQNSREFNRIVVHAEHGKIMNGKECDAGPKYKVFKVDKGTIAVQYQAPDTCVAGSEIISVYNSCEILPESKIPLNSTKQKDKIALKRIPILCPDAVLTITKKQHHEITTSKSEKKPVSGCTAETRERHDLRDDVEATIKVTLKAEIIADMPVFFTNQRWISYKPLKAEITVFRVNYDETEYKYHNTSGGDCDSARGFESNLTRRRVIINKPAIAGVCGPDIKVAFDTKTNKALELLNGMCTIFYGFNQNESVNARKWPKNDPNLSYSRDYKTETYLFLLHPVEDQVKDPYGQLNPSGIREYMKGKVSEKVLATIPDLPIDEELKNSAKTHPDLFVKTGDGINQFGGDGHKEIVKPLKDGTEKEVLDYKWNMKLIKK